MGAAVSTAVVAVGAAALVAYSPGSALAVSVVAVGFFVASHAKGAVACVGVGIVLLLTSGFAAASGAPAQRWVAAADALLLVGTVGFVVRVRMRFVFADALLGLFAILVTVWSAATATSSGFQAALGFRAWVLLAPLYVFGRAVAEDRERVRQFAQIVGAGLAFVIVYALKQYFLGYTAAERALLNPTKYTVFWEGV